MGGSQSTPAQDVYNVKTTTKKVTTTEWVTPNNASEPVRVDVQKIKIVLFGSQRVGKSSLVKRWLQNSFDADPESYVPTQKVSISSKLMALDNLMLAVEVWDTPSHPDIRDNLMDQYLQNADIVLLVGDVTKPSTFKDVSEGVVKQIKQYCELHYSGLLPTVVLIANKRDLQSSVPGASLLTDEVCQLTAESYGISRAFLVSAFTDVKVDEAFDYCLGNLLRSRPRKWHPADPNALRLARERERLAQEETEAKKREADAAAAAEDAAAEQAIKDGDLSDDDNYDEGKEGARDNADGSSGERKGEDDEDEDEDNLVVRVVSSIPTTPLYGSSSTSTSAAYAMTPPAGGNKRRVSMVPRRLSPMVATVEEDEDYKAATGYSYED